jgi:integrase
MHHVLQAESDDERVFRISNTGVRDVLLTLSNATGVEFTAHDLRRTFATYWIKHCQATNPSLAEQLLEMQLGHSNRSITRRHYLVLTTDDVLAHYVSPLSDVDLGQLNVS